MNYFKLFVSIVFICVFAACKKTSPENPPVPQAPAQTAVQDAAPASGPAAYMKGMAGNIGKAKDAAAVYERTAAEHMNTEISDK